MKKLVYTTIRSAENEGIWTKTIKIRTNLHQTVLTRVLKSLENRALIKPMKSVKFPGRKLYILAELSPSKDVTGVRSLQITSSMSNLSRRLWNPFSSLSSPKPIQKATRMRFSHHIETIPTSRLSSPGFRILGSSN